MKKIFTLSLLILAASAASFGQKVKFTNAIDYNDYIVDEIQKVTNAWDKAIGAENQTNGIAFSKELGKVSKESMKNLKKLGKFDDKYDGFRTGAIEYVKHMNKISKKELPKFIKMIFTADLTDDDVNKELDALIIILDDQRESKFDAMEKAQQEFARLHDFSIES